MTRNWIFLRGLGRHSAHWGHFIDEFQKRFPQDQIEMMDLRGNGEFAHSPSFTSIEDNVRDLRSRSRFLREKGENLYLMAISMGAMVATEWAHQHPEEIAGLVLINTSDKGSSNFFERLRPANYQNFLNLLVARAHSIRLEKEILQITTNEIPNREQWAEKFAGLPVTLKSNWLKQLWAASSYRFPDHKPKTEVLLLASRKDRLVSSTCTENIAHMWALKPHMHPTAGHDLPLEDGAWICQEIQNWSSSLQNQNGIEIPSARMTLP